MLPLLLAFQLAAAGAPSRAEVLRMWVEAIEEHRPGALDDAAMRVSALNAEVLDRAGADLRSVITLIRDPRASIFYAREPGLESGGDAFIRQPAIVYTEAELDILKEVARKAAVHGDGNRLLKRAAVLHTDLALFGGLGGTPASRRYRGELKRTTVYTRDGRQVALLDSVNHWEMARRLLGDVKSRPDRVQPDPQRDDDVRLWYRATAARLENGHDIELPHFAAAIQLFPTDADLLFLTGSIREMASAPGSFTILKQARGPAGPLLNLGSEEGELRLAESLFRRALSANPGHVEARLRLGRVLSRLGRHPDAAKELRTAVASTADRLLLYYGYLFLGGELDAQRDLAGARAAYERAAAIEPGAQSPRVALSQLIGRTGDRAGALAALEQTLSDRSIDDLDSFWTYHVAAGRDADLLMAQMYRRLAPESGR